MTGPRTIVTSSSAAWRLRHAASWLSQHPADTQLLILGGTADGTAELVRNVILDRPSAGKHATFGWHRLSLRRLALVLATRPLLERALVPASPLTLEALWTRVVHGLAAKKQLGRFEPVAQQPGLPRALARSVEELRLENVNVDAVDPDFARAARAFDQALQEAQLADQSVILRLATETVRAGTHVFTRLPSLWIDLPVTSSAESDLLQALAHLSPQVTALVPWGDERTLQRLSVALNVPPRRDEPSPASALARLQQNLFAFAAPPPPLDTPADEGVELLSAPGEMRECIELARAIHREMARGTPLDRMAVLLRAPETYRNAVHEAFRRAGLPAYYVRGTRQPDPAGRALLALLACAEEGLSARHFNEYLSLGEVPQAAGQGAPPPAPPPAARWQPSEDPFDPVEPDIPEPEPVVPEEEREENLEVDQPVVAGTLRAPRRWELLVVEAAVIGGKPRWEKRLAALAERYRLELSTPDLSEAHQARLTKNLSDLNAFTAYALPLIELLSALPERAFWSEWLERLSELASRALKTPDRVLSVLTELAPLGSVGPVTLSEVRGVLAVRLRELTQRPPKRRFGRLFVGPIDAARAMSFDVVFIPGLAERIFPQKVREDPLLPDAVRRVLSATLETDAQRVAAERLQLQLSVGAAQHRVVLSYPRIDSSDGRPRVPSFYGLETLRAVEGKLPRYETLSRRAERAVDARMGWPAPKNPASAIDITEWDLSLLISLFRHPEGPSTGAARYLTQVNAHLARSLRMRWARWETKNWNGFDGLVMKASALPHPALSPYQLSARAFSATALQNFASCPYRFYLSAIWRLTPREEPTALEELDPLQKGSMVHEIHYGVLSKLREENRLPLTPQHLDAALESLDGVLDDVARKHEELYAPAIDRVWQDALVAMRADTREWLRQTAASSAHWEPWRFELAFGLQIRDQRDPESSADPVEIEGGLRLRGSIDLVERNPTGVLRATDYKTGKARATAGTILGGGKTLQPVLYALALEKLFPQATVEGGRLYYCTQAGEFSEVNIPLSEVSRENARQAIAIVGEALEKGFFPAAPAKDECAFCDYRVVCGEREERRIDVANKTAIPALKFLREMK